MGDRREDCSGYRCPSSMIVWICSVWTHRWIWGGDRRWKGGLNRSLSVSSGAIHASVPLMPFPYDTVRRCTTASPNECLESW